MSVNWQPEYAASPASFPKKLQEAMRIQPFLKRQPKFDRSVLAASMEAFYGGRLETRITRVPLPVVYTDGLSAYCTSAVLMGLWQFQTAQTIDVQDVSQWAREFSRHVTLDDLLRSETWRELAVLVRVEPDGDVLPFRAYFDGDRKNASPAVAPYTAEGPEWRWLPDVLAAKVLHPHNKQPSIREAKRLVPAGRQPGLKPVNLFGRRDFDPRNEDFYRVLVEERARVRADVSLSEHERKRLADLIKAMGQAAAYGAGMESRPERAAADRGSQPRRSRPR